MKHDDLNIHVTYEDVPDTCDLVNVKDTCQRPRTTTATHSPIEVALLCEICKEEK
jgi:hypothetical protein